MTEQRYYRAQTTDRDPQDLLDHYDRAHPEGLERADAVAEPTDTPWSGSTPMRGMRLFDL